MWSWQLGIVWLGNINFRIGQNSIIHWLNMSLCIVGMRFECTLNLMPLGFISIFFVCGMQAR